jgi:NodT family efflux transporter outer membrane factor (OMF) lipoprotein
MKQYFLLLVIILNGCASKKAISPDKIINIPTPTSWELNISDSIQQENWWNEFNDSTLNEFLDEFLNNNINLEKTMLNTRRAKQGAVIAIGTLLPTISVGSSGSESEQNTAGFPPFFSTLFGQSSDEVSVFTQENFNLSLSTQWEIDLWGKLRQGRIASKQQYLSTKYYEEYLKLSLTAEAAKLYFSIIEAEKILANSAKKLANAETLFSLYTLRYNKGSISVEAYQQSEILLYATKSDFNGKQLALNTLKREANSLVKNYPNKNFGHTQNFPTTLPSLPDVVPADIIKRRPDLIAQQYNLLSSKALDKQALLKLLPSFSLTGSLGSSSNDLKDLNDEDFSVWSKGLSVFLPVFNAGKLIANKKIANTNKEIAMLDFINALLNAYKEVENAIESDKISSDALLIANTNAKLANNIYITTFEKFNRGAASFEDAINANNTLYNSLDLKASVEKVRLEQRINLILALGGGFKYKK